MRLQGGKFRTRGIVLRETQQNTVGIAVDNSLLWFHLNNYSQDVAHVAETTAMPSGQADDEKQAPAADFPAQDDAKEDVAGDDLTNALASPLLEVNEMPSDFARLHYTSGFPFYKRYNLQYVDKDDSVLIFVSGNELG